ncbi:MAG TPA: glycoside hydrolase family 3 N-terminal domain-containing protein, partial [Thermoanaerobaculia bacterium]|nr:glycoside hydrolase family 3 N-terminal domain-containing protein [Thermoanaerobaculia bacterium]
MLRVRSVLLAVLASLAMSCATTHTFKLNDLSTDEKIGQLFVPDAYGVYMSSSSYAYQRLERFVKERHVGGFVWFLSNVYENALLTKRLQAESRVPLFIASDLEAGMGMRFADTWYWPPAMAIAASGDPSLAEREGKQVALEAKSVGINWILAPVGDVNVAPDNPVINTRSFGEDPNEVSRYVQAFIRGVHSEGLLATAKHFPGHGDTKTDSHRSLPILDVTRERLDRVELVPFRAAIDANVDSVMMGHLAVPALDATPAPFVSAGQRDNRYAAGETEAPKNATLPATISKPMIDLLRNDLHFHGLVVTDAFDMGGLTEHFDAGEAAVRAIEAGEDMILMPANADAAMDGVKKAVASGRIPISRIDASVQRILDTKARVPFAVADPDVIFDTVDSEESRKIATEIATKAMTLVREEKNALPLAKSARVIVVGVSDFPETTNPVAELDRELRTRLQKPPQTFTLDPRSNDNDVAPIVDAAKDADVVILALAIRARSGAGQIAV